MALLRQRAFIATLQLHQLLFHDLDILRQLEQRLDDFAFGRLVVEWREERVNAGDSGGDLVAECADLRSGGRSVHLGDDVWARIGGKPFDTLSVMGVKPDTDNYIARTFENHGFYRHYALSVDDRTWLLEGETERARTVFSADGNTQTIAWDWLRDGKWLPLCDRVATRIT